MDTRSSMPWTEYGPNAELLRQARSGDVDALLRILDPYKLPLWRACLAITQQQDEADRLFEDTIGCATQELSGAPDGQPLLLWLVRLARELDAHHARTSPRDPGAPGEAGSAEVVPCGAAAQGRPASASSAASAPASERPGGDERGRKVALPPARWSDVVE